MLWDRVSDSVLVIKPRSLKEVRSQTVHKRHDEINEMKVKVDDSGGVWPRAVFGPIDKFGDVPPLWHV